MSKAPHKTNRVANGLDKFIATWQFLTIFPAIKAKKKTPPRLNMMPMVGLGLGFILCLVAMLFYAASPFVAALVVLLVWSIGTGFLHLDGLADLADALGAAHGDKTRFIEVLKAPDIGSFAVIALVLVLISKFALLTSLAFASSWGALLLIPSWARLGAAWWAESLPPLHEGLATWCKQAGTSQFTPWLILLLLLSLILKPILLLAPLVLWVWKGYLKQKIGGMNGDCLGAGIEICEVSLLLLCCISL